MGVLSLCWHVLDVLVDMHEAASQGMPIQLMT